MKKLALVLLLVIVAGMALSAQEANLYVTTLYIEKVYPHELGYKIEYRRPNSLYLAEAYLPLTWFGGPDSLVNLIYENNQSVPFLHIYWEGTEVHHMTLFVHPNYQDLSWGTLSQTRGIADEFDIETPEFAF